MKAYITLLSNRSYLQGVLVLHRSLRHTGAKYPLYCALSATVDEEIELELGKEGIPCIRLQRTVLTEEVNPAGQGFSHWNHTFDKLLVWGLVQFRKIVFLDCDLLIVRNIDSLFEREAFSAVSADSSYPGNEGWAGGLNSGVMVIEPDKEVEKGLLQTVSASVKEGREQGRLVGDQDVIKRFLPDWGNKPSLHMDEGYNLFADHLTYYVRHLWYSMDGAKGRKPVYVVHFIGKSKPWMRKTMRERLWMFKMCLKNPHYIGALRRFMNYLKA